MSETNEGADSPQLDAIAHSIVWRIRDAARYLSSIIPRFTSASRHRHDQASQKVWREAMLPQRMNRLVTAHSAIEDGLKYLIKTRDGRYKQGRKGHDLRYLLGQLRKVDPVVAASLDRAFAAATEFYGTNTQIPEFRHLASLPEYLGEAGNPTKFELMRYLELESSIDDLEVERAHIEFHFEILCAVDEAIEPRNGTIGSRVESLARAAFFNGDRLSSLESHSGESLNAYKRWFEQQSSFVEAMRKLTACQSAIGDQHADKVANSVCYEMTGHEDLALQTMANGLVRSESTQQGEIETHVHRPEEIGTRLVATPAGDELGYMRPLPTGFWLASDDPASGSPFWFRTERDARLWLAHMFIGELTIVTEGGHSIYQSLSKRPHPSPHDRQWLSLHDFNWSKPNSGELLLRFWDAGHGLQPGDYIEIDRDAGTSAGDLFWCGHITEVEKHVVYLREVKLRS